MKVVYHLDHQKHHPRHFLVNGTIQASPDVPERAEALLEEVVPNLHPDRRDGAYTKSAVGQAGYHIADTACPISAGPAFT